MIQIYHINGKVNNIRSTDIRVLSLQNSKYIFEIFYVKKKEIFKISEKIAYRFIILKIFFLSNLFYGRKGKQNPVYGNFSFIYTNFKVHF